MTTVRKVMYADEWYPVYELYETAYGKFVDFPEELLEEYKRIMEEFEAMQEIMAKLYDKGISVKSAAEKNNW